jgi:hypothetical protein
MDFSEELTEYVKRRGLKRNYILQETGISAWKYDNWKNGKIFPSKWERKGFILVLDTIGLPNG